MLDYTAIDFETANSYRGSPCSVGLVRVRDGRVVEQRHELIRPPEQVDWFDHWNTKIHGISSEAVVDAPRWKDALPVILDFIGEDVVVAHNAGFDLGVVRYACAVDNIPWPDLRFVCSLVLARRALELPTYRLPYVAEHLGYFMPTHHHALADAVAVVEVVNRLALRLGINDIGRLAGELGVQVGRMTEGQYTGPVAAGPSSRGFTPIVINPGADPSGYLYGRVVVFTGTLMAMTRDVARQECARVGAIPEQSTTKRTNVLVVGDINPAVLRPGSNVTGKARRAFDLQDSGQEIEVMTEDDFLRCLQGNTIDGVEVLLENDGTVEATANVRTEGRQREVPLGARPLPTPTRPPKPLKRARRSVDQRCSETDCIAPAAFRTKSKPAWCDAHIEEIQRKGGLRPLEPFTHPNDWQLTECLVCTVEAHYRFAYTLEKNQWNEPTCRACYLRSRSRERVAEYRDWIDMTPVDMDDVRREVESQGFDYLGPLTSPSLQIDPHRTQCKRCGHIAVQRLSDLSAGCRC